MNASLLQGLARRLAHPRYPQMTVEFINNVHIELSQMELMFPELPCAIHTQEGCVLLSRNRAHEGQCSRPSRAGGEPGFTVNQPRVVNMHVYFELLQDF